RRGFDRDLPPSDRQAAPNVPVMAPGGSSRQSSTAPEWAPMAAPNRTTVPYVGSAVAVAERETEAPPAPSSADSPLERILRGEHLAMVEVIDGVAGQDGLRRRDWELLLGGLVEALGDMAVRESVVDFPMGSPFWDTFTVEQCRHIVAALATMGFRYDGRSG